MVYSTESIVLGYINYSDTSIILKCFTEKFGVKSYLIKGIRSSKKRKLQLGQFNRLNIVDIESSHSKKGNLSYIKNVKSINSFQSINSNILKYNITLFISEILSSVIRHEQPDLKLFSFIKKSFMWFENSERFSNFHVLFLIYLTDFLGIQPENNTNNLKHFDLENGNFNSICESSNCIEGEVVEQLSLILGTKFDYSNNILNNVNQRRNMIDLILKYYEIHVPDFKRPKSLEILNELFS